MLRPLGRPDLPARAKELLVDVLQLHPFGLQALAAKLRAVGAALSQSQLARVDIRTAASTVIGVVRKSLWPSRPMERT